MLWGQSLREVQPDLIIALGARTATMAREEMPDVPMLYTLVLNARTVGPAIDDLTMGVALEASAQAEFTMYRLVSPGITRVLSFHHPDHVKTAEERRAELKTMGIELTSIEVSNAEELQQALSEHQGEG